MQQTQYTLTAITTMIRKPATGTAETKITEAIKPSSSSFATIFTVWCTWVWSCGSLVVSGDTASGVVVVGELGVGVIVVGDVVGITARTKEIC